MCGCMTELFPPARLPTYITKAHRLQGWWGGGLFRDSLRPLLRVSGAGLNSRALSRRRVLDRLKTAALTRMSPRNLTRGASPSKHPAPSVVLRKNVSAASRKVVSQAAHQRAYRLVSPVTTVQLRSIGMSSMQPSVRSTAPTEIIGSRCPSQRELRQAT